MKPLFRKSSDRNSIFIISSFFLALIVVGALLLCLPIASKTREWTPLLDTAFTATSATCVTGLAVYDTFTHWSLFGQLVILGMIQCGGLGVMTIITMFSIFLKRRISLYERRLLMQSEGTMRTSGVVRLLKRIVMGTLLFESVGALLLATRFCPELGFAKGIYYSVFHSVSAFCNAGFDLMGCYGEGVSLIPFAGDVVVNLTLSALIAIGGIGFLVWDDFIKLKFNLKKYSLHSKIVLTTTAALLLSGWILFFVFEGGSSMAGMPAGKRIIASLFQSVTARTAGFCSVPMNKLSASGSMLMVVLMFVGGSPGSTAGGIKTTTLAVLVLEMLAAARHSKNIVSYKRTIDDDTVKRAGAILSVYLTMCVISTLIIGAIEKIDLQKIIFEVVSAAATVGLSTGITSSLSSASHIILMILMFTGRVGGLTFMLMLGERRDISHLKRPTEKILIG